MSTATKNVLSKRARWGWGILLAVSLLLVLNGAGLFFITDSPATFEQDTGVPLEEFQSEFPTIVAQIQSEGQTIAVLLLTIGLMSSVAAWAGFRQGSRWAWSITGILLVLLAFLTVRFLVFDGRADIGGTYLVLAVFALVGQVLAGRR